MVKASAANQSNSSYKPAYIKATVQQKENNLLADLFKMALEDKASYEHARKAEETVKEGKAKQFKKGTLDLLGINNYSELHKLMHYAIFLLC